MQGCPDREAVLTLRFITLQSHLKRRKTPSAACGGGYNPGYNREQAGAGMKQQPENLNMILWTD